MDTSSSRSTPVRRSTNSAKPQGLELSQACNIQRLTALGADGPFYVGVKPDGALGTNLLLGALCRKSNDKRGKENLVSIRYEDPLTVFDAERAYNPEREERHDQDVEENEETTREHAEVSLFFAVAPT
uniref:Uncharacterized protein n=1 Tax=Vespula pensylvanica TaxID=30213 RepID=A0A834NYW1_VESPE|nr:hypothetical protein H0235_009209 [Vespula pensylvanica]